MLKSRPSGCKVSNCLTPLVNIPYKAFGEVTKKKKIIKNTDKVLAPKSQPTVCVFEW